MVSQRVRHDWATSLSFFVWVRILSPTLVPVALGRFLNPTLMKSFWSLNFTLMWKMTQFLHCRVSVFPCALEIFPPWSPSHSDRELHPAKTSPVPSLIPVMEPGRFIHLCGLETVLSRQCPGREQGQLSFQGNWSNDPKQRFSISVTNTIVGVVWLRRDAEWYALGWGKYSCTAYFLAFCVAVRCSLIKHRLWAHKHLQSSLGRCWQSSLKSFRPIALKLSLAHCWPSELESGDF